MVSSLFPPLCPSPNSSVFCPHGLAGCAWPRGHARPKNLLVAHATHGFTHGRVLRLKDRKCPLWNGRVRRVKRVTVPLSRERRRLGSFFACRRLPGLCLSSKNVPRLQLGMSGRADGRFPLQETPVRSLLPLIRVFDGFSGKTCELLLLSRNPASPRRPRSAEALQSAKRLKTCPDSWPRRRALESGGGNLRIDGKKPITNRRSGAMGSFAAETGPLPISPPVPAP